MRNNLHLFPEWYPQKAVWFAWPHNTETWDKSELAGVENEYIVFVKELLEVVQVNILVKSEAHKERVQSRFSTSKNERINFLVLKTNDAWIRDYGPDFVFCKDSRKKLILDWEYNSWGGKYPPFNSDNAVPENLSNYLELELLKEKMILEGGSFEVNGRGDLLTTKSCLLNKNRNPYLSQSEIETRLQSAFGVQKIHWLTEGISGDDTDGHIDDVARFVNEDTIVHAFTDDKEHPDYAILNQVEVELKRIVLNNGKKPCLVRLPVPDLRYYKEEILPCSYANFLITNKKILVPVFNCLEDKNAISTLGNIFEDREVVGVPCTHIIIGLGGLHCLSKHEFKLL